MDLFLVFLNDIFFNSLTLLAQASIKELGGGAGQNISSGHYSVSFDGAKNFIRWYKCTSSLADISYHMSWVNSYVQAYFKGQLRHLKVNGGFILCVGKLLYSFQTYSLAYDT